MAEVAIRRVEAGQGALLELRVAIGDAATAGQRLAALPGVTALALAPDRWLLIDQARDADQSAAACAVALGECIHLSRDAGAGLACVAIEGPAAWRLLAAGCGLDLERLPVPGHARTRLAGLTVVLRATARDRWQVFVDRSRADWLADWLARAAEDPLLTGGSLHARDD